MLWVGCSALSAGVLFVVAGSQLAMAGGGGERISVKLSSNKAGARSGSNITLKTSRSKVRRKIGVRRASYFLPKGSLLLTESLSRCREEKSALEAGSKCPKSSLIASGSSKIDTSYEGMDRLEASLRMYSGKSPSKLLMVASEPMTGVDFVYEGELKPAGGKGFGLEVRFDDLPVEPFGPGSGVFIYVVDLHIKLKNKKLYRNPRKCSGSGWRFGAQFGYEKGGSSPIVSRRVRCRR